MAGNDPNSNPPGGDNKEDDPYYDAYEEFGHFTVQELQNLMSDFNPNLMDLSLTPPNPQAMDTNNDTDHHLVVNQEPMPEINTNDDDMFSEEEMTLLRDMFNVPNNNNNDHVLGENDVGNNVVVESSRLEVSTRVFGVNDLDPGASSSRPHVTVTPPMTNGIFVCNCCNPVRRIVHANGRETMTLDIHGVNDVFCHAVLETQRLDTNERNFQTIHLNGLSNEDLTRFLESFHAWCVECGVPLVHDSNSDVYEPMNDGSNQPVQPGDNLPMSLDMHNEAFGVPPLPLYVGLRDEPKPDKGNQKKQTPLALQRARTQEMKLKGLTEMHFRLPIVEASKLLGVCPTVVKNMCRKGNLPRWPHRKIKSLERKISTLQSLLLRVKEPLGRARIEEDIEKLQKEISDICSEILRNAADQ